MRYAIAVIFWLTITWSPIQAKIQPKIIVVEAVEPPSSGKPPSARRYVARMFLKNIAPVAIKLPTKALGEIHRTEDDTTIIELNLERKMTSDGDWIVTPEATLAPVEIEQHEVAEVTFSFLVPIDWPAKFMLKVRYAIKNELGQRYGFWTGVVEVSTFAGSSNFLPASPEKD